MKRTSDQAPEREYWFKPVEEWLPAPVVHIKDIRTKKIVEFPKIQDTDETGIELQLTSNDGVVRVADDHFKDTNNNIVVVVSKILIEQQQFVSVLTTDTPDTLIFCNLSLYLVE